MPSLELKDRLPKYLWTILLFSALIVQFVLLSDYLIRWVDRLEQYESSSAILKSVAFSWDQNFADYSQFLREIIPTDARVILPPHNIGIPADHVGYMQYVLFPRDIHNCGTDEVEACIQRVIGGDSYILAVPGFPPKDVVGTEMKLVRFSVEWGIYVPIP